MSDNGSILRGFLWMFFISIILFWLPVLGPFIAGIVGGKKSGSIGNAIISALLPAIIIGLIVFTGFLPGFPLLGIIAGAGVIVVALLHIGPLFVGAIIGGIISK